MDFTPYLDSMSSGNLDEVLLSVAVQGKVALALKGRFSCVASATVSAILAHWLRRNR